MGRFIGGGGAGFFARDGGGGGGAFLCVALLKVPELVRLDTELPNGDWRDSIQLVSERSDTLPL
jgi:hypothetical protein